MLGGRRPNQGGCQSFALFLRQKMSWNSKPLSDEDVLAFKYVVVRGGVARVALVTHRQVVGWS